MVVGACKITLYAPWVHTLKEKRMEVQSLVQRVKNRFNVSAAEVEEMDVHQTIVIGLSYVSNDATVAQGALNKAADFIEGSTEAMVTAVEIEMLPF